MTDQSYSSMGNMYVGKERNEDADGAAIVLVKPEPFCGLED